jgi:hypothetical protein
MGYKSEIGLCLTREARTKMEQALSELEKWPKTQAEIIREMFEDGEKREDAKSGSVAYYWKDLKWFANYGEMAFVEKLLAGLEKKQYLFIRIGEADDDTEHQGYFWDNPFGMVLVRGITFNR